MNELNDYFRRTQGFSLLDPNLDASATTMPTLSPQALAPAVPQTPARDQFDFTPSDKQQQQALWSSLARMGAAMLANNRGPNAFASALGHGLGAQQEGYQGALQQSQEQNANALKSQMMREQFGEQQRQRTMQNGLRQAIGQLDVNDPNYYGQVAKLYAAAGDMDTALKANEAAQGGKPTEAQRNFNYLTGTLKVPVSKAIGVFTPMAPQPLQYVPPTENRPGGFVNTREGTTNFNEPPIPQKPKEIPATVVKSVADNRATLTKYDNTITALENEIAKGGDALGGWNYLGDTIRQRTDPQGVALRSEIADVGGQIMHDRSGAAVSVGEMARMKPYIPQVTDDPKTALAKLKMLRANVANETNALAEMYPSDQGYKPLAPWQSPRSTPAQPQRQSPAAPPPAKAVFGSAMSISDVQALAQRRNEPVDAVVKALKAKGVRVQ